MKLQKDYFLSQLITLKPTEEHLRSLAMYSKTFTQEYETIMQGIEYCYLNSSIHHRLILYYLMNEIMISEKDTLSPLVILIKHFIKKNFKNDLSTALKLEMVHNKFLELEKFWKTKNILEFEEGFSLEEIIIGVKETFNDKKTFIEYLEAVVEYYKSEMN